MSFLTRDQLHNVFCSHLLLVIIVPHVRARVFSSTVGEMQYIKYANLMY
jgi:hypothetical protein